jgi:fermentation-respiration switch protein FrsA (DUF1100 family)
VRLLSVAIIVVIVLVAIAVLVRLAEPTLAFFPIAGETETPADYGVPFDPLTISTSDGERLHAWLLRPPEARAWIVYFHGNGGNLSMWAPILAGIARRGYAVFAADYRGYGRSTGRPTERGLYRDVDAVIAAARARQAATPVIYWGRSLGATMASYAATVSAPDGLILEAAFPDARAVLRSSPVLTLAAWFSTYRFDTAGHLESFRSPTLVMHGDRDSIVPYALGRELFEQLAGPKEFMTIRGGDHNDAAPRDAGAYWRAVDAFIAKLSPPR